MKKILMFVAVLIAVIPCSVGAKSYEIKDYNIKIYLSEDYDVFTRDNIDEDLLDKYYLTYDEYLSLLKKGNIYLDAINEDGEEIFIITGSDELEMNNLTNYSSEDIKLFATTLLEDGLTQDYQVYKYNNITYIVTNYYDEDGEVSVVEYGTIVNSHYIKISLQVYDDYISDASIEDFDNIVRNLEIKLDPNKTTEDASFNIFDGIVIVILLAMAVGVILVIIALVKSIKNNKKRKNI